MSTAVAVAGGLAAAGLLGAGTALQYGAMRVPAEPGGAAVRSVVGAVRITVGSARWRLGTALLIVGVGCHAVALHEGSLALVQPLLTTGVLFALPAGSRVGGPPVSATDMRWAVVLVAALALFLITASPSSQPGHDIDAGPAVVTLVVSLAGVSVCGLAARRRPFAALSLGVAAGIAVAGSAALLKVATNLLTYGVGTLVASWQLYALIGVGATGLLLSQLAYRAGPLAASVPAIHTANPLVSLVIGIAIFDEHLRVGVVAVSVEGVSLLAALAAIVALSRRPAPSPIEVAPPPVETQPDGPGGPM